MKRTGLIISSATALLVVLASSAMADPASGGMQATINNLQGQIKQVQDSISPAVAAQGKVTQQAIVQLQQQMQKQITQLQAQIQQVQNNMALQIQQLQKQVIELSTMK